MTATSAGSSGSLAAKGLDISLAALKRQDPYINNIVDVASQVALYTYNNRANEWEKTQVEGTLFIYTRLASPKHGFTIMNRLSMENLTEPITKDLDFQLQDPFLLYRNARLVIHGIWFYDKEDCQRVAQRMKILTQQEQALAQSPGGWLSPGGSVRGKVEGKGVDIIQMLTKAHTQYDKEKSTAEPKEIGGSSALYGNPNLIKPIPVKPNTQDSDGAEPKPLSLATLFGSQHPLSSRPDPVSPMSASGIGSSPGNVARPPVARTLTYDSSMGSGPTVASMGGKTVLPGGSGAGVHAVNDGQTIKGDGGTVGAGVQQSPTSARQQQQNQQQQQQQQQHCPAIQKLMQGQRAAGAVGGVLQTLSESPENRLCDNGVPLEHHHHQHQLYHHHHHHQQQHHHHHHHQQQQQQQQLQQLQQQQQLQQLQQLQSDPIKRLFQNQPPPPYSSLSAAPPFGSIPPPMQQNPLLSAQHIMVDPASCSHLHAQPNQQLFLNLSKPQAEAQHNNQSAAAAQGTGLLPSQVYHDQGLKTSRGVSSQMPGVVSPSELLQKLQLVQQEQSLVSHDPPRPCPALAPRFLGPSQSQGGSLNLGPVSNQTTAAAGDKAALQFQVISPQRIPATVAPFMLLSPSVFSQVKSSGGLPAVTQDNCPAPSTCPPQQEIRVLSRGQFQSTLLHLIQTDSSFLDKIYDAYVSQFANSSSSKY